MVEMLTANLLSELHITNQVFNKWTDRQLSWLVENDSNYERTIEECERTITALRDNMNDLEDLKCQNEKIKVIQNEEIMKFVSQLQTLNAEKAEILPKLNSLEQQEKQTLAKFSEVKEEQIKINLKMENTVNELTVGLRLFLTLGLEFHKADNECMKFTFTQIDPQSPSKPYFFLLFVDASDRYQLVESSPVLDFRVTSRMTEELNSDNNISKFVLKMRRAFQAGLMKENMLI